MFLREPLHKINQIQRYYKYPLKDISRDIEEAKGATTTFQIKTKL